MDSDNCLIWKNEDNCIEFSAYLIIFRKQYYKKKVCGVISETVGVVGDVITFHCELEEAEKQVDLHYEMA